MFKDDLNQVKRTFKKIFKETGAYAVDYSGFNEKVAENHGDYFTFQCEKDRLQQYCKDNDINLKETQGDQSLYTYIYTYINGNKYFALNKKGNGNTGT